jgi:sugar phosphate isomerase/epimerase
LPLRRRIEAVSAAGFRGFGLLSADLPAAEHEYGLDGIRAMLDDNDIVDLELEGIPYWWDDRPRREESDRIRPHPAQGRRGARSPAHQSDAGRRRRPWDPEAWAAKFAELAAQAHDAGTRLGIEFFPWSNIKALHDGLRLVDDAGHDRRASSSTSGTSSGPTRPSPISPPFRCTGSSGSS